MSAITRWKHVTQVNVNGSLANPAIILVQFDGVWDLWFTKESHPEPAIIEAAFEELTTNYQRDWKGTKRKLEVIIAGSTTSRMIDCY